jgi:hypothetical protein
MACMSQRTVRLVAIVIVLALALVLAIDVIASSVRS